MSPMTMLLMIVLAVAIVFVGEPRPIRAAQPNITHTLLLKSQLADAGGTEVTVWDTQYAPGAVNPDHLHPTAVSFRVLSGTGIWQEKDKPPVTLHAGDSLLAPAGTIHSHWNPSDTEPLRFLEFIVAEPDKGRSMPSP